MKIKVIDKYGDEYECEVDDFEFRSNQVANWLRLKINGEYKYIHDVIVFKLLEE